MRIYNEQNVCHMKTKVDIAVHMAYKMNVIMVRICQDYIVTRMVNFCVFHIIAYIKAKIIALYVPHTGLYNDKHDGPLQDLYEAI